MKKFLFLLFTPLLIGQIDVVNTTTQLSLHEGTGIIILNSPDAYGGVYTYLDSTYDEGTFAFDHPYTGKQWARLGAFANATFTTLTGSNGETIVNTTDGQFSFGSANLLTTGTLGAGATTVTTITGTGTTLLKTGSGGSSSDSSLAFTSSSGSPLLTFYGTDGDAVSVGINTSDQLVQTGGSLVVPSVSLTAYSTITTANAPNTADADSLQLGTDISNLIKVRSTTSNSDSVVYITGGVANSYYQFKAVHTDTTITFADAINANLI